MNMRLFIVCGILVTGIASCALNTVSSDQNIRVCPTVHFTNGAEQVSPDSVATIVITVTYQNVTITNTFNFVDHTGTLTAVIPVNTQFTIRIEGVDSNGKVIYYGQQVCSGATGDTTVTISASQVTPWAPQNLTAYAHGSAKVELRWQDNASNETGFILKRSVNDTLSYTILDTIPPDIQQSIDSAAVQPQTVYYYRIMAYNAAGLSDSCEALYDPLEVVPTPSKPGGESLISLNTECFFQTDSIACGNGHKVQYQFDWADSTTSNWSFSQTAYHGWTAPGSYVVRVRARCSVKQMVLSDWSEGLSIVVSAGRIAKKQ